MIEAFVGLVVGLILSAPIGPLGLFGAVQAAGGHLRRSLWLALGVCAADVVLVLLSLFASDIVTRWLINYPDVVLLCQVLLGIIFVVSGGLLWRRAHHIPKPAPCGANASFGFIMTVIHPGNAAAFIAVFTMLAQRGIEINLWSQKVVVLGGVFVGEMIMWLVLLMLVYRKGARLPDKHFISLRCLTGLVFIVVAVLLLSDSMLMVKKMIW